MEENALRGRILKIKTGYNPNSSGIGVDIVVFFTAGAAASILFNTAAAVISAVKTRKDGPAQQPSGQSKEQK